MKLFFAFIMVVLSSSSFAEIQLFDSGAKPSSLNWNIVNDTVMGGRSSSRWISKSSSPCSFEGYLSLENNGGFASVRCDLNNENLTKTEGIFTEPAGGVSVSILKKMVEEGKIDKDEITVCYVTGNGLKATESIMSVLTKPQVMQADVAKISAVIG